MRISKEQKIMELVERQLDLLTITEALNIVEHRRWILYRSVRVNGRR
jgi:hypothetical protein